MMNCLMLEKDKKIEDNVIKNLINLFRLKKGTDVNTVKDIRNPFVIKK